MTYDTQKEFKNNINFSVGSIIKQLRENKGMNRNTLAHKSGLSFTFIDDLEKNQKEPTILSIRKICNALNITIQEFFLAESNVSKTSELNQLNNLASTLRNIYKKGEILMNKIIFYEETHWESLLEFFTNAEKEGKPFTKFDYGFIAAIFLLTSTENLRDQCLPYISKTTIAFEKISTQRLSSTENALVGLAANLYNGLKENNTSFYDITIIEDNDLWDLAMQSIMIRSGKIAKEFISSVIDDPQERGEMFVSGMLEDYLPEQGFNDIKLMTFGSEEMGDNVLIFECKYQKYLPATFLVRMTNETPVNEVDLVMFVTNSDNQPKMISGDRFCCCTDDDFYDLLKISVERQIENFKNV